ncbi:uncharacterized protein LOC141827136 [Curcuma longa]|uniref:uncharacterized protein LOC141827136 n=1 Tax=Curcuma longa TaxID=136217 RepID=UPI003D9EA90E
MQNREKKGRVARNGGASTDLMVCFSPTAQLSLTPKQLRSPTRPPGDTSKRFPARSRPRGQASPLFNATAAKNMSPEIAEPTSPEVTCSGQIKLRSGPKSWPRTTIGDKNYRKRTHWISLKKDSMVHLISALKGLDFMSKKPCLCSFHGDVDCAIVDESGGREIKEEIKGVVTTSDSLTRISKCIRLLENPENGRQELIVPPPNALLMMRCRSAPWPRGVLERSGGEGMQGAAEMIEDNRREKHC